MTPPGEKVAHELVKRLEQNYELFVQLALLVGLHVGQVVPQAHREAGILVSRILDEQATAEPLDRLALDDVRSIGESNSLHAPAHSLPHVIRITTVLLLLEPALDIG